MNENKFRHVFALSGVTGMLIATVLLLSILTGLTWWGIKVQQSVMQEPYKLDNPSAIKMKSLDNAAHKKIVKEK